jgi:cytochrome b subunit of formate dehydrogenase
MAMTYFARRLIPLAAFVLLAWTAPAGAQAPACTDCHSDVAVHSPVHSKLACADCHTTVKADEDHAEAAKREIASPGFCSTCHADVDLSHSVHKEVSCARCHGKAHDVVPVKDPRSPVAARNQIQTCAQCHPAASINAYRNSVHGRALFDAGLVSAPSCTTCHGSHDIVKASDPASRVSHAKAPATCGTCHTFILDDWQQSSHGQAWNHGQGVKGPTCVTCHGSHGILHPQSNQARQQLPETCSQCHKGKYETYRDTFHGKSSELGFVAAADCSDCHTPHKNLPAADPRSSVNPANLRATCGRCHGDKVTASFVSFKPHLDPRNPNDSRPVHYVWLFMTLLLVGVFGFFGLHDALWLQRSIRGSMRGEFAALKKTEGPYVKRFSRNDSRMHVLVIVTFLLLAATGLPLHFHHAAWAQMLINLFGGVTTARFLHRLAAIGTFGYMAWHIAEVFYRAVVRKEKGLFWGWKSMVPRWKDVTDIWQNFLYFLYRRPKPEIDRWSYWEKFDYLAVFWGVMIIGFSGLMLWLPGLFTRFLPGWVLNAAAIVHGDEALLAVGFIVIFHFFHTHLRPESFPLDPVIFVGSMPLERFKEERPLEYQRLVDAGKLDERLVDPPTPDQLKRARIFGFTAVAVGILLVIGILIGVILY